MIHLDTSIQYLKTVGPKKYELLKKLGLKTVSDLIYYFPSNWLDRRLLKKIKELELNENVTIYAKVLKTSSIKTRSNISIFKALLEDSTGTIEAVWFRKSSRRFDILSFLYKQITAGSYIFITGEVSAEGIKVEDHEIDSESESSLNMARITPVYRTTEKIDNKFLRKIIKQALDRTIHEIKEFMPSNLIDSLGLMGIKEAILNIHFPNDPDSKDRAYFRLAFDDFFLLQLALMQEYKTIRKIEKGHNYILKKDILTPFRTNLGFDFTSDQKKVINEIFDDLISKYPMNRLLQGDVGSGKTVVALCAMLLACENNYQAAIMVPTEVLAKQHFYSIQNFTEKLGLKIGLFTGSITKKKREELKKAVETREIDIIIGTHALLTEDINIPDLKLIVIDEQHRFGVQQRLALREKTTKPDVLVMTATPIPRTLALTAYGDLAISTIKHMPKGRKKIETYLASQNEALGFLVNEIKKGRQGYVIYPAVDEDNKLELKAATRMYEKLSKTYFKNIKTGLLHGKMKARDKNNIMGDFAGGRIKILVTTTVIEVGIDVSNASVIVIEHAERFGLATLHQLRGRVGRGEHKSYCFLVADSKQGKAARRLNVLVNSNDGFKLSEEDLIIRGPGEFLGESQHGFLNLMIGDIVKDKNIIELARKEVTKLLENKDMIDKRLINEIEKRYNEKLNFFKVG